MNFKYIIETEKEEYNSLATHPLQSYEWGEFRIKNNVKILRLGFYLNEKLVKAFSMSVHKIPNTPFNIGYIPKSHILDKNELTTLVKIAKDHRIIFVQLEPNLINNNKPYKVSGFKIKNSARPLFTKYTFVINLEKNEEELLMSFSSKTRYNIKIANKHDVKVTEDNSDKAFSEYLKLSNETTKRQGFYAHDNNYHKTQWDILPHVKNMNILSSHLLTAVYNNKILTAWILFIFKDTLYYPYGASSSQNRETMSSNLMMWEAIKFGKKSDLKKFDLWGALGNNPDPKDSWYGFHKFKSGYNPEHVEFMGSYDLIINPFLYYIYKLTDKLRWLYLRLK